jgi:hypothetical protein
VKKSLSNRQKKKTIEQGVRELKAKPGWDVSAFTPADPFEQLMALDQQSRDEKAFTQALVCADCLQTREKSGDESALCETHLAEAMGF